MSLNWNSMSKCKKFFRVQVWHVWSIHRAVTRQLTGYLQLPLPNCLFPFDRTWSLCFDCFWVRWGMQVAHPSWHFGVLLRRQPIVVLIGKFWLLWYLKVFKNFLPSRFKSSISIFRKLASSSVMAFTSRSAFSTCFCASAASALAWPTLSFASFVSSSSFLAAFSKLLIRISVEATRAFKLSASLRNKRAPTLVSLALRRMFSASYCGRESNIRMISKKSQWENYLWRLFRILFLSFLGVLPCIVRIVFGSVKCLRGQTLINIRNDSLLRVFYIFSSINQNFSLSDLLLNLPDGLQSNACVFWGLLDFVLEFFKKWQSL